MDLPITESTTPSLQCYGNVTLWKTEDSGYHTSFTPGSTDRSNLSPEGSSYAPSNYYITGHFQVTTNAEISFNCETGRQINRNTSALSSLRECVEDFTPVRRGIKRPHGEDTDTTTASNDSTATPTSVIAGQIQKLEVKDSVPNFHIYSVPNTSDNISHDIVPITAYPTTPVKKICKDSCKLSPFHRRKFARKVEFAIHSLSCEKKALLPVEHKTRVTSVEAPTDLYKVPRFRPYQKFDMIKELSKVGHVPLINILSYLPNEDIYNFTLVSKTWRDIWDNIIGEQNVKKQNYNKFWNAVSSNQENWDNGVIPKLPGANQARALRPNVIHTRQSPSPPGTPRSNKFRKFTKSASLDSRTQLSCIQCQHPAKVTKESSGEVWVECTNITCSYQFCKLCKGQRHPFTSCLQYDLNGPSPSKRGKTSHPISSKKSKKNLYRLLC